MDCVKGELNELNIYPSIPPKGGSDLIHELAHLWHCNIPSDTHMMEFEKEWNEISNNHYLYSAWRKGSCEDIEINGAVSVYALRNIREDIAETAKFVYRLNYQDKHPKIDKVISPKVKKKVELLREHSFISEREYKQTMDELSGFRIKQKVSGFLNDMVDKLF